MARKRVAVLISGRGSNMAALIEAAKDKNYPAEIVLVVSNRPEAGGLLVAEAEGIATEVVDHAQFGKDRTAFERALQAALDRHRIDIVCLAGFMRILSAGFRRRLAGPHAQHPPGFVAGLQGAGHPPPRARSRRDDPRCDGAFRGAGNGFRRRSSRRPPCPCSQAMTKQPWPRAC